LEINNLTVGFRTDEEPVRVLENVSCRIPRGTTVGLVGESGCGKSVTAMTIMRLLPSPPSFVQSGRIIFDHENLLTLNQARLRRIRGNRIGMIFQEPMTSLNPTFSVGFQLCEVLRIHRGLSRKKAFQQSCQLIEMIGIGAPEERMRQYPHQLSGGLRQRIMIAMALACRPGLLIADEPTTALDVTIQAQILDLLTRLQQELGMSILMITHDLGVVAEFCREVYVMYAGRVVEHADVNTLFANPRHPYTQALLASRPKLDEKREWLPTIPGMVPSPGNRKEGCYFYDRCQRATTRCRTETFELEQIGPGHYSACGIPEP
jgi:peptide/nickel transport system ATP-binding protein/oligopeptide transport system ATP-binding protein